MELIDTLWNVNHIVAAELVHLVRELIDTLWNVNYVAVKRPFAHGGINRYIMECK